MARGRRYYDVDNPNIPHDTVPRAVADAALAHALDRLSHVTEDRDVYREMLGVALRQVMELTDRVREQSAEIRRLAARTRLLAAHEMPVRRATTPARHRPLTHPTRPVTRRPPQPEATV